ncbi:MAG: EFR1 family ferrodoxin [Lentisphaeria bacterium]
MIYYFSATGNSEWVAHELAAKTGDMAVSIQSLLSGEKAVPAFRTGECLGLVFPIHAWRPPRVVLDFVQKLAFPKGVFVYAVCTMGETAGNALGFLQKFIALDSAYSLPMPNNYIVLSDRDKEIQIHRKISAAQQQIPRIAEGILARRKEFQVKKGPLPRLLTSLIGGLFNKMCSDRKFRAESSCTACGLCVQLCALNNISLENRKPVWHGNCMHCMACLQHCPVQAIQYGHKTKHRSRYVFKAEI